MINDSEYNEIIAVANLYELFGKKFPSDEVRQQLIKGKLYIVNHQTREIYGPYNNRKEAFAHITVNMHFRHYKVRRWKGNSFSGAYSHQGMLQQGKDGQPFHINPSLAYMATRGGHFD